MYREKASASNPILKMAKGCAILDVLLIQDLHFFSSENCSCCGCNNKEFFLSFLFFFTSLENNRKKIIG